MPLIFLKFFQLFASVPESAEPVVPDEAAAVLLLKNDATKS